MDYQMLGRRVRARRKELKLTQQELADQMSISASFLGHIERGTRVLSLDTLVKLCRVLSVTPNELLCMERLEGEVPPEMEAFAQESMQAVVEVARRHFGRK